MNAIDSKKGFTFGKSEDRENDLKPLDYEGQILDLNPDRPRKTVCLVDYAKSIDERPGFSQNQIDKNELDHEPIYDFVVRGHVTSLVNYSKSQAPRFEEPKLKGEVLIENDLNPDDFAVRKKEKCYVNYQKATDRFEPRPISLDEEIIIDQRGIAKKEKCFVNIERGEPRFENLNLINLNEEVELRNSLKNFADPHIPIPQFSKQKDQFDYPIRLDMSSVLLG